MENRGITPTELTRAEVHALMAELTAGFPGDTYNLVSHNCNHFCDATCRRLVRAHPTLGAKISVIFTYVISSNSKPVRRKGELAADGKAGIRSHSARQEVEASAPPRPRTFFRFLSVSGSKNVTLRPFSTPPSSAPASMSTSSAST